MFALIRLVAVGFVLLSIIFGFVAIRQRLREIRRLKDEYDAGGIEGSREDYVRKGLDEYESSFRNNILLAIYIVPAIAVLVLIYVMNFM